MEAKLVKEYGNFYLISDKEIQKGDEYVKLDNRPRMLLLGTTIASAKVHKLSLKNCEAIANGYDLDELAEQFMIDESYGEPSTDLWKGYLFGFQKALSILGDKKFSEVDLEKSIIWAHDKSTEGVYLSRLPITDFIQSLQQTEWDCIVEMEYYDTLPPTRQTGLRPKLDADGCLILKRK